MHLQRLTLANFRCYRTLDLHLPATSIIVTGANAQGKTSLLEAIYMLATTRAPHTHPDHRVVNWTAKADDVLPYTRVHGDVVRTDQRRAIDVLFLRQEDGSFKKTVRLDGSDRRSLDVLGILNVVYFAPQDISLVADGPSERRRYLDILLCQIDPEYCRSLSRYNRILGQRNHLLRRLHPSDARSASTELAVWDDRLVDDGVTIVLRRLQTLERLTDRARPIHDTLAEAPLRLRYRTNVPGVPSIEARSGPDADRPPLDPATIREGFRAELTERRTRELDRGVTTVGPHRDEVFFTVDDVDMRDYGSRGQQRTVVLALKLAEARLMRAVTGEAPVLLLDDVLSELDVHRRDQLLQYVDDDQQMLITTADLPTVPEPHDRRAVVLHVSGGEVVSATRDGETLEGIVRSATPDRDLPDPPTESV